MDFQLIRTYYPLVTLGILSSEGFSCAVVERPKVGEIVCIPEGQYVVKFVPSTDSKIILNDGYVYELQNVVGRTAILLHNGNYVKDSLGCLLLNNSIDSTNTYGIGSDVALARFYAFTNKIPQFNLYIGSV
jgi:hypothetical protein